VANEPAHQQTDSESSYEVKDFRKFTDDLRKESDRAAAIIAAAKADLILYQLIQKFLLPSASGSDELLDDDSALGTFSSRINFAYRAGLITADFARALHLMRRIRNQFAHEPSSATLNSGPHQDRIRELVAPFHKSEIFKGIRQELFEKDDPASDFRTATAIIVVRLTRAFQACMPLSDEKAYGLVPPEKS
jgi:hypothetical protein